MNTIALPGWFRSAVVGLTLAAAFLTWASATEARVTRIVILRTESPAFGGQSFGDVGQYETITGRAEGVLDPTDPLTAIIQDIDLVKDEDGLVRYVATFFIVKPIDMSRSSGLLWHDVPNRGGRITLEIPSRVLGDVGLSSGWQGDNSGATAHTPPPTTNDFVVVPVAKNPDGSSITGPVLGRILNASGVNSQRIIVHSNPLPYRPASLDTTQATLVSRTFETIEGVVRPEDEEPVASEDWAWARCSAANPFPGTPDPTEICVRGGFIPNRVYQVVFTAKDPYVLGIGFAAFRDVGSFFKYEAQDDFGTPNPLAGRISWIIGRGSSQSGNFLRAFLHLGFNQDEARRQVQDGTWPIIAGRRVALNFRFAMPDGVLKLYEPGSEGPQWWVPWPDPVRGLPTRGILDRCTATNTCPKIVEHFGAAEIWGLKLGIEWVGTDALDDIPLPANVRRYYIPSTQHGGGPATPPFGFDVNPAAPPSCPSTGYGRGTFPANPIPHVHTVNAIRFHFRNWVMNGTPPPPSRWPLLATGDLVRATSGDMGFPAGIPGIPAGAPTGLINPVLDYNFGDAFDYSDATGVQTVIPPMIRQVITARVPRVDVDGNEMGGVPVVLRDAPIGTYLGWNITEAGFHADKICNYAGGMIPFARSQAERLATGDPRLSLEERYTDHAGYVRAVELAAANAVDLGFLLPADADTLVQEAQRSNVLNP